MINKTGFGWQSQEERLKRHANLPPQKRVEWLYEMQEFMRKVWTKKQRDRFWQLRQAQAWGQGDF